MIKTFIQLLSVIVLFGTSLIAMEDFDKNDFTENEIRILTIMRRVDADVEARVIAASAVLMPLDEERSRNNFRACLLWPNLFFFGLLSCSTCVYEYIQWQDGKCAGAKAWQCAPGIAASFTFGSFIGGVVGKILSEFFADVLVDYKYQ